MPIARRAKDQRHPKEHWQPIERERSQLRIQTPLPSRLAPFCAFCNARPYNLLYSFAVRTELLRQTLVRQLCDFKEGQMGELVIGTALPRPICHSKRENENEGNGIYTQYRIKPSIRQDPHFTE